MVAEVEGVDISGKKKALTKLRGISLRIMGLTGRVPSILIQILQEQKVQIKKSGLDDAPDYIDKTNEAIKNHTLLRLGGQIRENAQRLSETHSILSKLSNFSTFFISSVTPGIIGRIENKDL